MGSRTKISLLEKVSGKNQIKVEALSYRGGKALPPADECGDGVCAGESQLLISSK